MVEIPESHRDLIERPLLLNLGVILPGGQPQVTPMLADYADGYVRINTVVGRAKHRAMIENPLISGLIVDPDNPFRWAEIRGRVVRVSEEGAEEHVERIGAFYRDEAGFPDRPEGEKGTQRRVVFFIEPTRVVTSG